MPPRVTSLGDQESVQDVRFLYSLDQLVYAVGLVRRVEERLNRGLPQNVDLEEDDEEE